MRFWDSSALIPLLLSEPHSAAMRKLLAADSAITVWWGTVTECASALWRRHREGVLSAGALRQALGDAAELLRHCEEIQPTEGVRLRANRLLAVHAMRAADALQLAAGLARARERTVGFGFVCLDARLAEAARKEGFDVMPD